MQNLKLLIVEGNTKQDNSDFKKAGCVPQSINFSEHVKMLNPNCEIDIVEPCDDQSVFTIIPFLKKYDGIILTGSTLRINDENSNQVKKHIDFAKICFQHEKIIFAACWGLQVCVTAAGGKCRIAPNGAHVGIAYDVEITNEGKKHKLYNFKPHKFTTPAFNYDEVATPPNDAILLASDEINKFQALYFKVGRSEIWGLQYHPEIPYEYMLKLIRFRKERLIKNAIFKNEKEIDQHISLIEKEKTRLTDDIRLLELKNWLERLERKN